uniref:Uncharacterized protein n=1 Tax=Oryza sativa subsp. japonica TaxID=39947 RepID=Q6Z1H5_ORYSJ|nr:hypothetical protein [Oryza sativa Japonica Group]
MWQAAARMSGRQWRSRGGQEPMEWKQWRPCVWLPWIVSAKSACMGMVVEEVHEQFTPVSFIDLSFWSFSGRDMARCQDRSISSSSS